MKQAVAATVVVDTAVANTVEAEVAEAAPDEAQGAVVVNQEHNQAGQTDAMDAAVHDTSTEIAPMMQIAV